MRYIVKAATLAVVLALLASVSNVILAGDYITDAAQALQSASVYVAPGTEGTDKDTVGKMQARLNSDDNIVLVMLPAAAEVELGADISTIASRLSEKLENKRVIGLAVGRKVVGYAPSLPPGVAADQMKRAESVSNDPVTTLGTFVQNVHIWQAEHPQPKPSPVELPKEGGISWIAWLFMLVGFAVIGFTARMTIRKVNRVNSETPSQVKTLLVEIEKEFEQIYDPDLRVALYQMCLDIERYFKSCSKNKKEDSLFLRDRLKEAAQVLDKYIDIQNNQRYYNKQDVLLRQGKEALTDFCQYVLDSIRRGNDADLTDYKVNADILQAHRRLANPDEEFDRDLRDTDNR